MNFDDNIKELKRITDNIVELFNAGEDPSVEFIVMLNLYATTLSSLSEELHNERYLGKLSACS